MYGTGAVQWGYDPTVWLLKTGLETKTTSLGLSSDIETQRIRLYLSILEEDIVTIIVRGSYAPPACNSIVGKELR